MQKFTQADHAPIGFFSFDLDYYSSTIGALNLFQAPDRGLLPRIICYFDDVVTDGYTLRCFDAGALLAIREFNMRGGEKQTLAPVGTVNLDLVFPAVWTQQLWVYHRFRHPEYNQYIGA